jgi:hypothetical protein
VCRTVAVATSARWCLSLSQSLSHKSKRNDSSTVLPLSALFFFWFPASPHLSLSFSIKSVSANSCPRKHGHMHDSYVYQTDYFALYKKLESRMVRLMFIPELVVACLTTTGFILGPLINKGPVMIDVVMVLARQPSGVSQVTSHQHLCLPLTKQHQHPSMIHWCQKPKVLCIFFCLSGADHLFFL